MTPLHHHHVAAPGAEPSATMLLLHGIYGAGRNWRSVARRLVDARPGWRVTLVDLRSHGRSPRLAPHTVEACAADLAGVEDHLGRPADAVLGHSFGGKVALLHARRAAPAPRRYWIVDSAPGAGRPAGGAWRMLGVLRRRPGPFGSRAEAVAAVEAEGYSPVVARWMATNIARDGAGGWGWGLDPDEMEAYLRDYFDVDAWDAVEEPPEGAVIHFVKASSSAVLDAEAVARIRGAGRGGRVFLHEVEGGHWLNAENPDAVVELLAHGLPAAAER